MGDFMTGRFRKSVTHHDPKREHQTGKENQNAEQNQDFKTIQLDPRA